MLAKPVDNATRHGPRPHAVLCNFKNWPDFWSWNNVLDARTKDKTC